MGIIDNETIELLKIRNQIEFGKRYKISQPAVLTRWNKKIRENDLIPDEREFFKDKTRNVLTALYRNAIIHGNAAEAKLFFQYVKEWREKIEQEKSINVEELDKLADVFKKMMTNKNSENSNDNSRSTGNSKKFV